MRARAGVFACAHCVRSSDRHARLRSFILLPAIVAAATAIHAPAAFARSSVHWDEKPTPRFYTQRLVEERGDNEARSRRRSNSRSHTGVRRQSHHQVSPGKSRYTRSVAVGRSARGKVPLQKHGAARRIPSTAATNPVAEVVPIEQRSLVATHPLAPDPILTAPALESAVDPAASSQTAAPRCKTAHSSSFALTVASLERGFQPTEPAMVESAWPHCRGARNPQSSLRLASLGPIVSAPNSATSPSLSGGPINWRASASCLASPLQAILGLVASNFGPLTVNSTCRSPSHNARVGGAPRSMHLTGNAVDFRVRDRYADVLDFLVRHRGVGGYKHYGSGVFHIDTGPRRTWGARRASAGRRV